ncbi:hypothetical protein K439DRAFT_1618135 [Ramaria rubella]|nr:hypothetical protein K439DRAFT_1618135 [Ramaria rubella]
MPPPPTPTPTPTLPPPRPWPQPPPFDPSFLLPLDAHAMRLRLPHPLFWYQTMTSGASIGLQGNIADVRMQNMSPASNPALPEASTFRAGIQNTNIAAIPAGPEASSGPNNTQDSANDVLQKLLALAQEYNTAQNAGGSRSSYEQRPVNKKNTKTLNKPPLDISYFCHTINQLIELTLELLNWNKKAQPLCIPPPEPVLEAIEDFAVGKSCGPTTDNFLIYWSGSPTTGWNKALSHVFADEFFKCQKDGKFARQDLPVMLTQETVALEFRAKIRYLKKVHREILIQLYGGEEEREKLTDAWLARHEYARRCSHRDEILNLRLQIISLHPEWSLGWKNFMERLGVAGMSLDETVDEELAPGKHPRFYRVLKPWRSKRIGALLAAIDRAYTKPTLWDMQPGRNGNFRRERIGNHPTKKNNAPKDGYPSNFYEQVYLRKNHLGTLKLMQ